MLKVSDIRPTAQYSTMQLSRLLAVNRSTICRWCNDGKLRFSIRELNGRRVFIGRDVLEMLRLL